MHRKNKISVVIPCLNEAENLPFLIPEVIRNIPGTYDYEIICVDDGSTDNSSVVIKNLCLKNKKIKALIFHKRFGQQTALMAGVRQTSGNAVITMDADFQHPPEKIPDMLSSWQKGNDLVLCQKNFKTRQKKVRGFVKQLGYMTWQWVTDGVLTPGVSEFMLMDQKVVFYIKRSKERETFLRGLASLSAVNPTILVYTVGKRKFGKSRYTILSILNVFVNGFISFSTKPLRLTAMLGLLIFLLSLAFLILDLVFALLFHKKIVSGYLTIVFLVTLLNGFIIFYLGILGEYIGVIFREVKARPRYIINKKINF